MLKCFFIILLFISHFAIAKKAKPFKRKILSLWDSREFEGKEYTFGMAHQNIELIFNHYGFLLEYVDVGSSVPDRLLQKDFLNQYAGVLTWFTDAEVKRPLKLIKSLDLANKLKLKTLILGDLGFTSNGKKDTSKAIINNYLSKIGLRLGSGYSNNPLLLELVAHSKKEDYEFERPLMNELFEATGTENIGKKNKVLLSVKVKGREKLFDVIVKGQWGAYVQTGFALFRHPKTYRNQWRIDPFKLVKEIFVPKEFPSPDTNTVCGKRLLYIHIDGDGFINVSNIDRKTFSGEVVIKDIINKYKLPTTASVVVAEISPSLLGSRRTLLAAKKMFESPYVEPASHTYSHPLSWSLNPTLEERKIYLDTEKVKDHKGPIVAYKIPGYLMNYEKEVKGSLDYINQNLTSPRKKAKILLWSGSCRPPAEAIKRTKQYGVLNMNGGDSRLDKVQNSYTNLSSLYRKKENYYQIYTSNANENLYTNLWTGPYNGFRNLVETFHNTKKPILIKPMNIYYHFYSGERKSSLKALNTIYEYAISQRPMAVYASDYAAIVNSMIQAKYHKLEKGGYLIEHDSSFKTVRVDKTNKYPDYQKSKNIIGHKIINESLYIFLGKSNRSTIFLTTRKPSRAYIKECNGFIESLIDSEEELLIKGEARTEFEGIIDYKGKDRKIKYKKQGPFELKLRK